MKSVALLALALALVATASIADAEQGAHNRASNKGNRVTNRGNQDNAGRGMSRPVDEDGNPVVPVDEDGSPCADGDRACVRAFYQANRPERPQGSADEGMGGGRGNVGTRGEGDQTTEDVTCGENQVAKRNKRGQMVCKCTHGFRKAMAASSRTSALVCTGKANTRPNTSTSCKSGRPFRYGCAEGETAPCCSGCKNEQHVWTQIGVRNPPCTDKRPPA